VAHTRLITFDADDTLWDFGVMMMRGNQAVAEAVRVHIGLALPVESMIAAYHDLLSRADPLTVDYLALRRTVFRAALADAGYDCARECLDWLVGIYTRARDEGVAFYPGALDTLAALKPRYKLGYITNGTSKPGLFNLDPYFDVVVTPETLNLRKPRPEVFHHAAALGGCQPGEMLHIGDSLETDVAGAQAAGCRAVWFNPGHRPNMTAIRPDAEIDALPDVLRLL
jgi:putative hydrolase of the HAD superfamily